MSIHNYLEVTKGNWNHSITKMQYTIPKAERFKENTSGLKKYKNLFFIIFSVAKKRFIMCQS